jgi:multisubunit Na+/H+ antiporter MnhB subunit
MAAAASGKTPAKTHEHDEPATDWFAVLDVVIWVAVGVIVLFAAEWLFGKVIRERLSHEAQRFLRRQSPAVEDAPTEGQ